MRIKIELLSDLCTSSGETYNSLVDIDVVYDDYGLPYIPAKRIKGCIREACLELKEFGLISEEQYIRVFGAEGSYQNRSAFSISNAYLDNYEGLCADLRNCYDTELKQPQKILSLYTSLRTQTAVDYETGTAIENSLRTMRTVNKGLVFYANLFCDDMPGEDQNLLKQSIRMVKHIGIHRTRGLGLVSMTLSKEDKIGSVKIKRSELTDHNYLSCRIFLKEPMLCKSAQGDQAKSQDHIAGSKILGLLAGALGKRSFSDLMNDPENELIVSNAYIEDDGERCVPLSASIQKIKDQVFENGSMNVFDMLCKANDDERSIAAKKQLTPVGYPYINEKDGSNRVLSVDTEINYHHRRPDDKSIGRADGNDSSAFYQLEGIRRGQAFRGFILANRTQAEIVLDAFSKMKNIRMGYGRQAEYGAVDLEIEVADFPKTSWCAKEFVLRVNSSVILYNKYGMPTADAEDLLRLIKNKLNDDSLKITKSFIKYETIGGFNVTWGRRKPVFTAIGKGSVFLLEAQNNISLEGLNFSFIGERVNEGYGEIQILPVPRETVTINKPNRSRNLQSTEERQGTDIIFRLRKAEEKKDLEMEAREGAAKKKLRTTDAATISRMILVSKEQHNFADMGDEIKNWAREEKKGKADRFFEEMKQIEGKHLDAKPSVLSDEERYRIINDAYLTQLKYQVRKDNLKGAES